MATFKFWVIGDTGYTATARTRLADYLSKVPSDIAFIIHVGDIWARSANTKTFPTQQSYTDVATTLRTASKPMFIVPGDNETCDTVDQLTSLGYWRNTFVDFQNNWQHSFTVTKQAERAENWRFVHQTCLFIGYSHMTDSSLSKADKKSRLTDAKAWITASIAAEGANATCCVLVSQSDPKISTSLNEVVKAQMAAFDKPFLVLRGDTHKWLVDNPYASLTKDRRIVVGQTGVATPPYPGTITVDTAQAQPNTFTLTKVKPV